jgi:GNAT superfamily N-acetyltransferase
VQPERFDPAADAAATRLCHEMYLAGLPVDAPNTPGMSQRAFTGWLAKGWTEARPEAWLVRDGSGQVCGWYLLNLPERENRHIAYLDPLVAPACRRRGFGTGLVRHAAAEAHRRGRRVLAAEAREGAPAAAFWRALGGTPGITEAPRLLRLDTIPAGRLALLRARAQSAARGYSLVSWEGQIPEEHHAAVAALNQVMGDAPRDEGQEEQRWDEARVRESQQRVAAQGLRYYTVAARCERTGELAGMTQVGVDPFTPRWAFQEMTAVARPHRGHRLGLLVKVGMLELLADCEPLVKRIYTSNADTNEHMVAINVELGFQVIDHWRSWELPVAAMLAPPGAAQPGTAGSGAAQS